MLDRAEYKRRQAPPGVKITRRAFGRDRRYPIVNAFHDADNAAGLRPGSRAQGADAAGLTMIVCRRERQQTGERAGRDFIRDIVAADIDAGRVHGAGDALSARAQRLSPYRPRQVDLPQFRRRRGIRRALPSALRRHQPDQGGAGIHRRDRARRALARLRLGHAPLSRLGLFRAALRLGRASDPAGQGLCRRHAARGDARRCAAR